MKKLNIVNVGILIIASMFFINGCSLSDYVFDVFDYEPAPAETTTELLTQESEGEREEETQTQEQHQYNEIPELYYAYHKLDSTRQTLYREMFSALVNMEDSVRLSTTNTSLIDTTFACVVNDHPELFYVEGYQYTEYSLGDTITSITFQGTFTKTPEEVQTIKEQIDQSFEECLKGAPVGEDEYYIVKYFYDYLISHTEYDKSAPDNQNICSVFLGGRSVCQGYAEAFQYMLQSMNIQAFLVTGFTNSERHAWNLVRVNGEYYYIDPTWGDASYTLEGKPADSAYAPPINFDYFLVTTDELTRTHSVERAVELPQCTSTKDNYFVREGLYFDSYDTDKLALIFDSENARDKDYITIKCATSSVYDEIKQHLIERQEIFNFISDQGESVAYTSNQYQRTISFWNIFY